MAKKNTSNRKNREELKKRVIAKNAETNSHVTNKQRKNAIRQIKHAKDAFNIPGQIKPKDINLANEYLIHDGQIVRKTKAAEAKAKEHARAILSHRVRLIDAIRAVLPAINNLQSEYLSQQNGLRILTCMLKQHGYTEEDLMKAAKVTGKNTAKFHQRLIKNFVKKYTKEHSGKDNK